MISDKDRSGYFGASDAHFVMGNWTTKTWDKWFVEKLGFAQNGFANVYTQAGTYYEHAILDSLGMPIEKDNQIIIEDLLLRVNLDGNTPDTIYEVKTYKGNWKNPKNYREQVQVQMFAKGYRKAFIIAYQMTEKEYSNFFLEIDSERISKIPIEYDEIFIETFLQRLLILKECVNQGKFPTTEQRTKSKGGGL